MEYKPEMTPKVAVDLLPSWVWFWASMYISATNLGPFSSEMLIHTSPAPAPSQGHSPLHQSSQQRLLHHFVTISDGTDFLLFHLFFFYHVKYTLTSIIFICKLLLYTSSIISVSRHRWLKLTHIQRAHWQRMLSFFFLCYCSHNLDVLKPKIKTVLCLWLLQSLSRSTNHSCSKPKWKCSFYYFL